MPTTSLGFRYPSGTDYAGTGPDVPRAVGELAADLDAFLTGKYSLMQIVNIFTGTTTYTPASGVDALYVECQAAGGGGGGCITAATNGAGGGGGGAGSYAALWTTTIKTFTVAVGAKGTGVSGGAGTNGGVTTFDSPAICSTLGGVGGSADTVAAGPRIGAGGGSGGSGGASVGDLTVGGGPGHKGIVLAAAQTMGGHGGNSHWGNGGPGAHNTSGSGGNAGNYGGGGGGAVIVSGGANQAGGNGGDGLIRVWEFSST